jgi:tRNA1Val (adenine37-N6)-methyltransferase
MPSSIFAFKYFNVSQENSALKVGTDAMLLGALVQAEGVKSVIDIGAGSGVLSLMVAQKNLAAHIHAVEIDEKSFLDCQLNFLASPWSDRLTAIHADICSFNPSEKYDLIISNPPFYSNSLINADQRTARTKHSEFLPIGNLVDWVKRNISDTGKCWLIWPFQAVDLLIATLEQHQLILHQQVDIYSKTNRPSRVVVQFGKEPKKLLKSSVVIRQDDGNYTEEYIGLTRDFHAVDLTIKKFNR